MCLFQTRACCRTLENDAKRETKEMMSGDVRQTGSARQGPEKRYQQQEKLTGEQEQAFMDRLSSSRSATRELYLPNRGSGDEMCQMEETSKNGLEYWASSQLVKLLGLKKSFSGILVSALNASEGFVRHP